MLSEKKEWLFRLEDILREANYISERCKNINAVKLYENTDLYKAVLYSFTVIGEAANNLPESFLLDTKEVEWHKIISMRNRVIHEYFGVDEDIIFETATIHIPKLIQTLRPIYNRLNQNKV